MRALLYTLTTLVGFAAFMSVIWVGCGTFLKNNEAYERGLETALADSTVTHLLGAPVVESWFLNGAIESGGGQSNGSWSTRIRGSERSGTLHIAGYKRGGAWGVVSMRLTVGGETYSYLPGQGFVHDASDETPDFDILSSWRPLQTVREHRT